MATPDAVSHIQEVDDAEHGRSLRRAAYLTIGVGLAHAVLFVFAYWLLSSTPGPGASDAEIVAFYSSEQRRRLILVGLYVMPFAGIAFLWFIVALRMWIAASVRRENVLLSNVQLVSGIVFIALFFTAAAASASLAASVEFAASPIDPIVAREFPVFSHTILLVFAMRMAAIFVSTTSSIGRSADILPRWFVLVGYGTAAFLLLSATFNAALVLIFPVWLIVLCVLLWQRARRIPASVTIPDNVVMPVLSLERMPGTQKES